MSIVSNHNLIKLKKGGITQARVIAALLMREILTRFGRHNIGFLWMIGEPMMFTLGVTALWVMTGHKEGQLSVTAFVLTGYSSLILWRNCANRCALAITPNLTLLYHRNVKVMDIFMARILLEAVGAAASFILLVVLLSAMGLINWPVDVFTMLMGWLLLFYYSMGLGLLVGVISERSELFDRFWHVVTYLLFPVSGGLYIVDWLPKRAQQIVLYLPSVHATEMIREGYYGKILKFHYDVFFVISVCSVMVLVGLLASRKTAKLLR